MPDSVYSIAFDRFKSKQLSTSIWFFIGDMKFRDHNSSRRRTNFFSLRLERFVSSAYSWWLLVLDTNKYCKWNTYQRRDSTVRLQILRPITLCRTEPPGSGALLYRVVHHNLILIFHMFNLLFLNIRTWHF